MKRKTIILNAIGFLLTIIGYSYFRSYMDNVSFLVALDKVISIIISEFWKLSSSPTIFIAVLIAILIYSFRENLLMLFPAIKEIKAGSFSATIDYSILEKMFSGNTGNTETAKDLDTKKKKEDVQNYLLERFSQETLVFFLELDGKPTDFTETLQIAERLHIGEKSLEDDGVKKLSDTSKKLYLIGNLVVLLKLTFPALFDTHIDENLEGTRILKDGVRSKIEARLKALEQRDKS